MATEKAELEEAYQSELARMTRKQQENLEKAEADIEARIAKELKKQVALAKEVASQQYDYKQQLNGERVRAKETELEAEHLWLCQKTKE